MKRWFRWWGIAAFAVLVVLVAVGWLLLADRIVKNALQSAGTRVVGAQVDIRKADLSLFPAGLTLIGLQVTNPQQPMQNAVEAERIAMSLDAPALLQRKILIEELTLEGVRLNTPRKRSGAVKTASSRRDDAAGKKAAPSASESDLPGELLSGAFIVPDVGEILKNEKLQTLVLAESLRSEIEAEKRRWEQRLDELPDKEKLASYRSRIDRLKNARKGGLGSLLGAPAELVAVQNDLKRDIDRIEASLGEFEKQSKSFENQLNQLTKAPEADLQRLTSKYSLSPGGLSNIGGLFLKHRLRVWIERAIAWYQRLQPLVSRPAAAANGPRAVVPLRGTGVNIRFAETTPQPDLLIRRVRAGIDLKQMKLTGDVETITSDPPLVGRPLRFDFVGKDAAAAGSIRLNGLLDSTDPQRKLGKAHLQMQNVAIGPKSLSDRPEMTARLQSAVVDLDLRTALDEERIHLKLEAGLDAVRLSAESSRGDSGLARALSEALAGVRRINASASVDGTLLQQQIQLTTDLDRVLKDAVTDLARRQATELTQSLRKGIRAETNAPIKETGLQLDRFGRVGDELSGRLALGDNLLKGLL